MTLKLVVCVWLSVCLSGCQSLTKLDALDVVETSAVKAADAGRLPPPAAEDAGPRIEESRGQCVLAEGAECNLIRQCGCEPDQHCQTRTSQQRPTCVTPGELEPGSGCHDSRECPRGQTCDHGSCRSYCERDEDCGAGACFDSESVDSSSADNIRVCWQRCELSSQDKCASGTTCRSVETPSGDRGTYCVAPFDPCPTTGDGHCDEPSDKSAGTCAEGSDSKDCQCRPTLPGAPCDPLNQCGCGPGLSCQVKALDRNISDDNVPTLTAKCVKPGPKKLYEECALDTECGLGLTCDLVSRVCVNYCYSKEHCQDGACKRLRNPDDLELGLCTPRCDRSNSATCVGGTSCATFAGNTALAYVDEPGDYCFQPFTHDCPVNGVCDEPQGTGVCAALSDPLDCCGVPPDGECNAVTGCGCESIPGARCVEFVGSTSCFRAAEIENELRACRLTGDDVLSCPVGHSCVENDCRKYCATDADCNDGASCVLFTRSGREVEGLGACYSPCDFDAENACPEGQLCFRRDASHTYCGTPYDSCPSWMEDNGICDDVRPGGTRYCAMGTDPECETSDD